MSQPGHLQFGDRAGESARVAKAGTHVAQAAQRRKGLDQSIRVEIIEAPELHAFATRVGAELDSWCVARQHSVQVVDVRLDDGPTEQRV